MPITTYSRLDPIKSSPQMFYSLIRLPLRGRVCTSIIPTCGVMMTHMTQKCSFCGENKESSYRCAFIRRIHQRSLSAKHHVIAHTFPYEICLFRSPLHAFTFLTQRLEPFCILVRFPGLSLRTLVRNPSFMALQSV